MGWRVTSGMLLWWITQAVLAASVPVPDILKPWQDWVLFGEDAARCPFHFQSFQQKQCYWPGQLSLMLEADGLRFDQDVQLYAETTLDLPGSDGFWPTDVTANDKPVTVAEQGGKPSVRLAAGHYRVSGSIPWQSRPDSILIPPQTALLQLQQQNTILPLPRIDVDGRLWLVERQNTEQVDKAAGEDHLTLQVFRHLQDDIPFRMATRLDLQVSGKPREVLLGKALLDQFVPQQLDSQLPARIEADGSLRVQVRPGQWTVQLTARRNGAVEQIKLEAGTDTVWPDEEIWVLETLPSLRQIRVEGVSSIDPNQTSLPDEWKAFPSYRLQPGEQMTLLELRRGDPQPSPNQLNLERGFWLDFSGEGFTVRDQFNGNLYRDWRLTAGPDLQPGSLELNGAPQVITRMEDDSQGIEVRTGALQASALSRTGDSGERHVRTLSATGWQHDVDRLQATLQLPPGWRVLTVTDVDSASNTWSGSWNVWDIFIVLIAVVAVWRLRGVVAGAISALALLLIYPEAPAFLYLWLNVISVMAILFVLPEGKLKKVLRWYGNGAAMVLALWLLAFLVDQARLGLYPQLQLPWLQMGQQSYSGAYESDMAMPASAPMEAEMAIAFDSDGGDSMSRLAKSSPAPRPQPKIERMDPNLAAQTGPGQPNWEWMQSQLYWSGPVTHSETFSVWLLTPLENRLLAWLRVALGVLMLGSVLGANKTRGHWTIAGWRPSVLRSGQATAAVLALLVSTSPFAPKVHAELPDPELLETLKQRLLAETDCTPSCLGIERTHITLQGNRLGVRFTVHAQQDLFWPLPDSQQQWHIDGVLLNGQPHVLRNLKPGQIGLQLPVSAGQHDVQLTGTINPGREFQLSFPVPPHNVSLAAGGWNVRGIDNGRLPSGGIYFTPAIKAAADPLVQEKTLNPDPMPAFVTVRREVRLGLNWYLETLVQRVAPQQGGITLEVPLLAGESVTTQAVEVVGGKVRVQLKPGQQQFSWLSTLDKTSALTITADVGGEWSEHWIVDPSPLWHVSFTGIAPLKEPAVVQQWRPQWRPYPGEQLQMTIQRPTAVVGATTTIDQVQQTWTPGQRETSSVVRLHVISSKGSEQRMDLPEDAQVKQVRVNGESRAAEEDNRRVIVPVNPGQHWIEVEWNQPGEPGLLARTPAVTIAAPYVNHSLQVQVPANRWVLLVGGPSMGPAILFWGVTLVTLLVALALGRFRQLPLTTLHWVLLVLGLCAGWIQAIVPIALWFFTMHKRNTLQPDQLSRWQFNLMQLSLAGFSLFVFGILLTAIPNGLLGSPDMGITGNGSSQYVLNWFVDRGEESLTTAWVVSVPLWIYRALMLAWSLWLALHLLRWLKWGWQAYTREGYWRSDVIVKEKLVQEK
jgi:hypothetical protein